MQPWIDALADVTFHAKLGTEADRVARIAALARELAPSVGADPEAAEQAAEQAARIAKADLVSEMVYEFPELQGVMGRYYALEAGFSAAIANAVAEHYAPLGPSDTVPTAPVSVAVSLAEKIDKLTGFWAIDEKPTGSKDPFALRRAALGVIRLVLSNDTELRLRSLVSVSYEKLALSLCERGFLFADVPTGGNYSTPDGEETPQTLTQKIRSQNDLNNALSRGDVLFVNLGGVSTVFPAVHEIAADLLSFFHDRLKVHLRDEGIRHDVIDACLAMDGADDLTLLVKRARALADFLKTDDGENLLQGFKRANNILTQAEEKDGVEYSFGADVKFAETDEERALFAALDAEGPRIDAAMQAEDFGAAMGALAQLRAPIDAFFEAVQVNADAQVVRRNRLNLLSRIRRLCLDVADLTRIEG